LTAPLILFLFFITALIFYLLLFSFISVT